MAKYKARINATEVISLSEWDAAKFSSESKLNVISSDLTKIKSLFTGVKSIEVYVSDNLVKVMTDYDGFSSITFLGEQFIESENLFDEVMEITLTKVDLVEQIQRLDNQINPTVDVDAMTLDELKEFTLKSISAQAQEKIFSGVHVGLEDGRYPLFTFKIEDQTNLAAAITTIDNLTDNGKDLSKISEIQIPYHSSGEMCQIYSAKDILTIYATLYLNSSSVQTYANMLNVYVRSAGSIEEVKAVTYGMELPEMYQERYDSIYAVFQNIVNTLMMKYFPSEEGTETSEQ